MKREKKPRRKKLLKRLKSKFRLTVLNESTFEERFSYSLTPMNVIVMFGGLLFVFGLIIYLLLAFTPLKVYLVPGYVDVEYREEARVARMKVDSINQVLSQQQTYLNSVITIFNGGQISQQIDTSGIKKERLELTTEDSLFDVEMKTKKPMFQAHLMSGTVNFNSPLTGKLVQNFGTNHKGVDIASADQSPVSSVETGMIIFAGPSVSGGYEVHIQHAEQFISIYKGLGKVFKSSGTRVDKGDAIGLTGGSYEESLGRHVHLELWKSGYPVDPTRYLVLTQ
jgi:murein DD-endopeptidase MepM/ murein hydrolase activator NlpD